MGFYWIGFIFWVLIGTGLMLSFYGLWKNSWKLLLLSGIVFLIPMLYFGGAENWLRLLVFVPLVPFALAYYTKKKIASLKK